MEPLDAPLSDDGLLRGVYLGLRLDHEALADRQRALCARLSLHPRPELHLTLLYLGDLAPASLAALVDGVRARFDPRGALPLRVLGVGAAGAGGLLGDEASAAGVAPRVAWWSVEGGDALRELRAAVVEACAALGLQAPGAFEPFAPHITLGSVGPDSAPLDRWDSHGIEKPASLWAEGEPWSPGPALVHATSSRCHPASLMPVFPWPGGP